MKKTSFKQGITAPVILASVVILFVLGLAVVAGKKSMNKAASSQPTTAVASNTNVSTNTTTGTSNSKTVIKDSNDAQIDLDFKTIDNKMNQAQTESTAIDQSMSDKSDEVTP